MRYFWQFEESSSYDSEIYANIWLNAIVINDLVVTSGEGVLHDITLFFEQLFFRIYYFEESAEDGSVRFADFLFMKWKSLDEQD